jgi:hypothetical protein
VLTINTEPALFQVGEADSGRDYLAIKYMLRAEVKPKQPLRVVDARHRRLRTALRLLGAIHDTDPRSAAQNFKQLGWQWSAYLDARVHA